MAHLESIQAVMGKAVQEIQLESQSWYAKAAAVVEAQKWLVKKNGRVAELKAEVGWQLLAVDTRYLAVKMFFFVFFFGTFFSSSRTPV